MEENGIRLNKYLSDAGVCSRREADRQIEAGNVLINGITAVMGQKVTAGDKVQYCGKAVSPEEKKVILLLNKPRGIVCTAQKKEKNNIVDYLNYPLRIYPVGRLDKDSSGLLLMTNDGEIVNKIMRAGNRHEKEYIVTVNRDITPQFLKGMEQGVPILGTVTRKCNMEKLEARKFKIVLTQGLNRQIRRMCEYFDYKVLSLKRVRIMNLQLGDLREGEYREILPQEKEELFRLIADSSNETVWNPEEKPENKKG
jgi:23S rRNA pseudouridine2604 synthase